MTLVLEICPQCHGRGRYRPRHTDRLERCGLCQATGDVPVEFADRTSWSRREGMLGTCDRCLESGMLLPIERPQETLYLCSRCWARQTYPEAPEPEPVPF